MDSYRFLPTSQIPTYPMRNYLVIYTTQNRLTYWKTTQASVPTQIPVQQDSNSYCVLNSESLSFSFFMCMESKSQVVNHLVLVLPGSFADPFFICVNSVLPSLRDLEFLADRRLPSILCRLPWSSEEQTLAPTPSTEPDIDNLRLLLVASFVRQVLAM